MVEPNMLTGVSLYPCKIGTVLTQNEVHHTPTVANDNVFIDPWGVVVYNIGGDGIVIMWAFVY